MEYLVLDVGSAIKYALMNDELEFLEKGQVPTPKTSLEDFKRSSKSLSKISRTCRWNCYVTSWFN